jgi:hypothetical protein
MLREGCFATPLARRRDLPEMCDNREGVSPVPPLPLSHSVGPIINHIDQLGNSNTWRTDMSEENTVTSLKNSEYFAWYNEEITRYRDHEWQLASLSFAVSSAVVIFAKNSDTKDVIAPCFSALLIIIFVLLLLFAELHTHYKLNQYRKRRDLLLAGKTHTGRNKSENPELKTLFFESPLDAVYILGFTLVPVLFGLGAAWVLVK